MGQTRTVSLFVIKYFLCFDLKRTRLQYRVFIQCGFLSKGRIGKSPPSKYLEMDLSPNEEKVFIQKCLKVYYFSSKTY
jgi:hypothetical protein